MAYAPALFICPIYYERNALSQRRWLYGRVIQAAQQESFRFYAFLDCCIQIELMLEAMKLKGRRIADLVLNGQPRVITPKTIMPETSVSEAVELRERTGGAFPKWFVLSAGVILAFTGIAKFWGGLGNSKFLSVIDPIIGIKFGQLMLAVGVAEIVIALVCFFSKWQTLALGLVAWLSTNFVVYRLGLWWMNWHRPCSCLGNLTDALHLSPQTADNVITS